METYTYRGDAIGTTHTLGWTYEGTVCSAQDGVIQGDEMFNFDARGNCTVYSLSGLTKTASFRETAFFRKTASFRLDKADLIVPHSNAVCFGAEHFAPEDEFPLLYSNIYNNYAKEADRLEGVCLVYRLTRDGGSFRTKLVQIIRIGFTEDLHLWKSLPDNGDVRPYGNFIADPDRHKLYAFVMRDGDKTTRYFTFALPKSSEGEYSETWGVPVVTLTEDRIESRFDEEYSRWIQGACCADGKIWSVEGFSDEKNPPALRVIDMIQGRQTAFVDLWDIGLRTEPEFVDWKDGVLFYRDASGKLYTFRFL